MENLFDLTDDDGEVRELTEEEFASGIPFRDLPEDERITFSSPVLVKPDGEPPYLKIYGELLERYVSTGEGWQNRFQNALRDGLDHAA